MGKRGSRLAQDNHETYAKRLGNGGVGAPGLPAGGLAGQSSSVLHELKIISSSRSRYRPTCEKRAVDVRAGQLHGEYLMKARAADRRQGVRGA